MRCSRFVPSSRRSRPSRAAPPGRRLATALILSWAGCLAAAGAASAQAPRAITIDSIRGVPRYPLPVIADYEWALATAVSVLEQELRFPVIHCTVLLVPDKQSLRESLVGEGHSGSAATDAAEGLAAVASSGAVRINQRAMLPLAWPERVQVLAHELTHVVENQLSGDRRATSPQWLREGLAVWVSLRVLEILGHGQVSVAVRGARGAVARKGKKPWAPRLSALSTYEDWARAASQGAADLLYDHALLATDALIRAHGLQAALFYFSRFAESDDRDAHFLAAFHEESASFEARFEAVAARRKHSPNP